MNFKDKGMSVALLAYIGKTPDETMQSFVFDEAFRLAIMGLKIHVIRANIEEYSFSYGIHYHGFNTRVSTEAIKAIATNIFNYPLISLFRNPSAIYNENLYATAVCKVAEKNKIDLIHAHFAYPEGLVGLLSKKRIKKPLIVTVHGYDVNTAPGIGYGLRLDRRIDVLVRKVLKNADLIICVSNNLRKEILKIGGNAENTLVVFNAVDVNVFRPPGRYDLDKLNRIRRWLDVSEGDFIILNARHLKPVYGIEYLIYAAKLVAARIKNAKFIIAGDGELKGKLNNLIYRLGIEKNVKLIGNVPKALMPRLMQTASIYVNTSLCDGMSPSMLEAFSTGVPIVSFNVGGACDIVDEGVNGFLVSSKDYEALASRVIYLLENPDLLKKFSVNARKKAEECFDAGKRIRRIISIYEKLIG